MLPASITTEKLLDWLDRLGLSLARRMSGISSLKSQHCEAGIKVDLQDLSYGLNFSGILKRTAKIAAFRQEVKLENLRNLRVKRQSENTFYLGSVNLISWHFPPQSSTFT